MHSSCSDRPGGTITYRVQAVLDDTEPPVRRTLELASDLSLADLHDVLQLTFCWDDYHLHRFARGPEYYSDLTDYYLCPFEVDQGEDGIPEERVRLGEVLTEPGDTLMYLYDFGDHWMHTLTLDATAPRTDTTPRRGLHGW